MMDYLATEERSVLLPSVKLSLMTVDLRTSVWERRFLLLPNKLLSHVSICIPGASEHFYKLYDFATGA